METRRKGDKRKGRNGGKGSFEVRKLGRWKRGEKIQMTNEIPNPKNTDYTDNKKTRGNGDTVTRRKGDTQDERVA